MQILKAMVLAPFKVLNYEEFAIYKTFKCNVSIAKSMQMEGRLVIIINTQSTTQNKITHLFAEVQECDNI